MWRHPPAIREAATGIFLWAAWGLYDSIKGDKITFLIISPITIFRRADCPAYIISTNGQSGIRQIVQEILVLP